MIRTRRWKVAAAVALLGFLTALGCDSGSSSSPNAGAPPTDNPARTPTDSGTTQPTTAGAATTPTPKAPDVKAAAGSGTLVGRVTYNGDPPKRKAINFGAEKKCHDTHETPPMDETLVVAADRSVQWVLVRIASKVAGSFPAPSQPVVLDQKGCIFTPHVVALQTGQEIDIRNSDPVLHNVRCEAAINPSFNRNLPKSGDSMKIKFDAPEVGMKLKCDVHFWMAGSIHVIPHPFFAVTGADGRFTIEKLPPGQHKLEVWHEKLGKQSKDITVKEGDVQTVDFTFDPK